MDAGKTAIRAWTRQQTRLGQRTALPVAGLGLLGTALAIGQAWCIAVVLATGLAGHFRPVVPLVVFGVLALIRAALAATSERLAARAGAVARRRLRSDALGRLLAAGPALLRRSHSAELTAIVVDRIEALDGLFARWVPAATLALAGPLLVLIATLIWVGWRPALVLAAAGLFVPVAMAVAGIGAASASRRQFLALARLQARFLDRVRGIATIVLAGRADTEAAALARAADELRRRTMRVLRVAFLSSAALDCAAAVALVFFAIHYATALRAGQVQVRTALFALLLVPEFFAPLRGFSAAYQDRLHATGAAESLATLPPAPVAAVPAPAVRTVQASGVTIAFEDVRLTWDAARGPALDGLSFRLAAGETLILAGPSGSGKSTVLEILLGFVRPEAGRVTLNGADIASVVPEALSRMTAWIGQRPLLFAGSIAENIRFARPGASDEDVARAAAAARVAEFAAGLPQGLETPVGEGGFGLSGGQAQRVAIARAFLKGAPLLLLDEPTAHLDPATEAEVLESLKRLAIGRTVILATHSAAAHAFGGRRLDLRAGRALAARAA
ncbi:MAG TPA: thiol reductant ABC exporter subunit CydD [Acetobacteraceae bacterium]|nr:thiol reductant ABC exporter subunit CydD [Acetobacteraceae bacterium]